MRRGLLLALILGWGPLRAEARSAEPPAVGPTLVVAGLAIGQGCPVGAQTLLTARHVLRSPDGEVRHVVWGHGAAGGRARVIWVDPARDLAVLATDAVLPQVYPLASQPPAEGAPVWLAAYRPTAAFGAATARTTLLRVLAGHLILAARGAPGWSGSCVWDRAGQVVGIFIGHVGTAGTGVAVWGPWAPLISQEEAR